MPLYIDIHRSAAGLTSDQIAEARRKILAVQKKHGVDYRQYWYSEEEGAIFWLCEAPSKEAAAAVHREAHGGMSEEIVEVKEGR
jgi:hypothetical protein